MALGAMAANAAAPRIHAYMAESDEWLDAGSEAVALSGFYTFAADGSEGISAVSPVGPSNDWAEDAGVYADGKYYCFTADGTWYKYSLVYRVINADTWAVEKTSSHTYTYGDKNSDESQMAYMVPSDMAYDPVNDVIYAAARKYASQLDSYLCTLDRTTGLFTRIAEIPAMAALTADSTGKLYGIGIDGNLYTIAADGTYTTVGHTGFWPSEGMKMSATTDYTDNIIYWSMFGFASERDRQWNENGVFASLRVDPATAETKLLWNYPRSQRFTAVNILNAHPLAPADIADFTFGPQTFESTTALFEFTVPALTSSSRPIEGNVTVELYIDGSLVSSESVIPGSKYSKAISGLAPGTHTGAAQIISNGHMGNKVTASAFFGADAPAPVSNLTLTADATRTQAHVSWTAPTLGANGSPINSEKLRYKVVMQPGALTIETTLKATEFDYVISHEYADTYFEVTPYHVDYPANPGKTRRTNVVAMGEAKSLPFSENFDTAASINLFTLLDVDGDGSANEWASPCWKYDEQYYCAFYYGRRDYNANDWLITPPLAFDSNKLYRLRYKWYAYYGYGSTFRVALGSEASADGMDCELQRVEKVSYSTDMPGLDGEVIFAVRPGDRYIGFHHISENMEHLSIDDILIEECGDARTPDHLTALGGERLSESSLRLTVVLPANNARGDALNGKISLNIYRDGATEPLAAIADLTPGQTVEWDDTEAVKGINSYYVAAANEFGEGLGDKISVDLTDAVPQIVTGVTARFINERQIEITWDALDSAVGENGNPIDLNEVRYLVFKPVPDADGIITYDVIGRDINGTRFVDHDPMAGLYEAQQGISYYVCAVNGAGQGYAAQSNTLLIGEAYTLPFAETWKNQVVNTFPWSKGTNGANWYVRHQGYDPVAVGQDGYGLLTCEVNTDYTAGTGIIMTPRMDLSSMSAPELSFYYWTAPSYADNIGITVALDVEGEGLKYLPGSFKCESTASEWKHATISLADYASATRASIYLIGYTREGQCIHLDNFKVEGSAAVAAVRAEHISGPAAGREGQALEFVATVRNLSANPATRVAVALKLDSEVIATANVGAIAAGATATATLPFTPAETHIGSHELTLEVTGASCAIADCRPVKELSISAANLPVVRNLTAESIDSDIFLQWGTPTQAPEAETVIDSFESYPDFTISDLGGWTLYDGDGLRPFQFSDGEGGVIWWPNCGVQQSFICFNPVKMEAPFSPASGDKMLVCMGSPYGANNDWLISPELSGEQQLVSFFVATLYGGESAKYNVLVSRTDRHPESFQPLNGSEPLNAPADWDLVHFGIPAGTKYFAIQYVDAQQYGIKIDDVLFHAAHNPMAVTGYNLYCNGTKLNEEPLEEQLFFHSNVELSGTYTYTVRPIFGAIEGDVSNEVTITHASISEMEATSSDATIYDLQGRRRSAATSPGLYIIGGQKQIRR